MVVLPPKMLQGPLVAMRFPWQPNNYHGVKAQTWRGRAGGEEAMGNHMGSNGFPQLLFTAGKSQPEPSFKANEKLAHIAAMPELSDTDRNRPELRAEKTASI